MILTAKQVADKLGYRTTGPVRLLVEKGLLKPVNTKIGTRFFMRFDQKDISTYVALLKEQKKVIREAKNGQLPLVVPPVAVLPAPEPVPSVRYPAGPYGVTPRLTSIEEVLKSLQDSVATLHLKLDHLLELWG